MNGTWEEILAEAAKCEVLCANCHAMEHAARRGQPDWPAHPVVAWRRRAKLRLVAQLGGACVRCAFAGHVSALHFHHRDPATKEFAIGTDGIPRAWSRLLAEAEKCDLLCANCHREAHAPPGK